MPRPVPDVRDAREQAKRLLKDLRSGDPDRAQPAANLFCKAPMLKDFSPESIAADPSRIQLKHALAAVARDHGYVSWKKLKDAADVAWYPRMTGFLTAWYARYEEAKVCHDRNGGYLLTHKGQFFVCEADFIESLGIDPNDPRWERIGYDAAKPADKKACEELYALAVTRKDWPGDLRIEAAKTTAT